MKCSYVRLITFCYTNLPLSRNPLIGKPFTRQRSRRDLILVFVLFQRGAVVIQISTS